MLVVYVPHAVAEDGGVAVAQLVILVYELLLVGFPAFGGVFLGFEERAELAGFVCFRESSLLEQSALYLAVCQSFVALDGDCAHLHLLFLVDDDVEYHLVFLGNVVALYDLYVGVLETLVVKILCGKYFGTVNHVGRDLSSLQQAEFLLHIGAFRLL